MANKYNSTPTKKPVINPYPTLGSYDTTSFDSTEKGEALLDAYNKAKGSVNNYAPFNFSENGWLENVKQGIQNYGEFSYDLDKDALYQQYKDKYIQMGKLAMADTMGQAAAMTGGYANSYAQSVGQQAYQGQLDNLNDIVPELYQMALDRYNMGKEDLYNQYGMLLSEYEREYGIYSDEYNKLLDTLGLAKDDYYGGGDIFRAEQSNKNDVVGRENTDKVNAWTANTNQSWAEYDADEAARQYANSEYWKEQDWNLKLDQERYQREQDALKKQTPVKEDEPEETASDYADWDYGDWENYFASIRNDPDGGGKSEAEEELSRMIKAGFIPKEFIVAASIGARGSLGH